MCERSVLLLEEEDDDELTTESTIMIMPSAATPFSAGMVRTVVAGSLYSIFPADDACFWSHIQR
jgi:hypothetical protein